MAVIYKRKLNLNGKKILLGGIGRLRVAMNKRKQGIGNIIMNFAMTQLSKINCDVVLLCTDTQSFLVTWYEKFGFALMSKQSHIWVNLVKDILIIAECWRQLNQKKFLVKSKIVKKF